MALTPKQEAFCVAYVEIGNRVDAYRAAGYSAGMSEKTAGEAASRLLSNSKVVARLIELRAPAVDAAQVSLEGHLRRLEALGKAAEKAGKYSAAVAAEMARGKVSGLYVEKVEHSGALSLLDLMRAQEAAMREAEGKQ